jgi:hypothetical protein
LSDVTAQALLDLVSDFDAAIDRLRDAPAASDEQRRGLREALACLYELRVYRERTFTGGEAYWDRADRYDAGKVTEGIVGLRGEMVHKLVRAESEMRPLYPSEDLRPSDYLYPGENLTWVPPDEMDPPPQWRSGDRRSTYYETVVAGQPVLPTLDVARHFLVDSTFLGRL